MSAAETIIRELRALRAEIAALRQVDREAVREEITRALRLEVPAILERVADEAGERRARNAALRHSAKLSDDEARRLRAWGAENRESLPRGDRTPERWLNGTTRNPRRATVAHWWTDTLGRPEPELIALLEGDGDEGGVSGPQDGEGAAT